MIQRGGKKYMLINAKKAFCVLFAAILTFACLPAAHAAQTPVTTILMYMCGTDLQQDCVNDLYEMCAAGIPDSVNLVVMAGGASEWADDRLSAGQINLFTIQGNDFSDVTPCGEENMGDPATLTGFLDYGLSNYPADRTMLVLWDHGNGATGGICYDELNGDDCLTLNEITAALSSVQQARQGFLFDLIGCDACLMGSYEAAVQLAPYGQCFVASQELEPWLGWAYEGWLSALNGDPGMDNLALGRAIADAYYQACMADNPNDYFCLSVVDLTQMKALNDEMEAFSAYLSAALENGELNTVSRARRRMYSFGEFCDSASDMVDLKALLNAYQAFAPSSAARVQTALKNAVSYSIGSDMFDSICGLSILMPYSTREEMNSYMDYYDADSLMPNYTDFIRGYAEMLNGGDYVFSASVPERLDSDTLQSAGFFSALLSSATLPSGQYVGEESAETPAATATPAPSVPSIQSGASTAGANGLPDSYDPNAAYAYSMTLSADDLNNLSYVEGVLMMDVSEDGNEAYVDLGYLQNAWVDWQGSTVYSLFDGRWPMLEGQMVAMYDQVRTEAMRRSVIPVRLNGRDGYLVVVFNAENPGGTVLGFSIGYDENGLPARGTTPLKPGDVVTPTYTLLSFDEKGETIENSFDGDDITVGDSALSFGYESLEGGDATYLYCFCLNDIYGGYQFSDYISFEL